LTAPCGVHAEVRGALSPGYGETACRKRYVARFKREGPTREQHIIGQLAEATLRDLKTPFKNVGADKMTRRKITAKKRDRVTDTTAEVEHSQVLTPATAS
jgi:hypothetical protein